MKYADLIDFEPIESVVQIATANVADEARRLVQSFVISNRMAEILVDVVIPQLQFAAPADSRGILVVGNYGTGKSHLMAAISAIAEHGDLVPAIRDERVAAQAAAIAGKFRVIRSEIGSTTMSLHGILSRVLEDGLARMGVPFDFPAPDERHENKSAFQEMMAAFQAKFPGQGLLVVVDELLDYLRSRKDQELSLDLSFLRELGEVCRDTRFRFVAGVQESLFDNPRFQFVAETLRRVKDRFNQVRIAREDVAYVVSERLLRKTDRQRAMVREHLTTFAPFYGSMNERMDEFVSLFPVHPAYLETFERVYVAEKREVLRTLSAAMKGLLDQSVPEDAPGILAYDSYWQVLRDNPSFRSIPEIKEVIDKTTVLEGRIEHGYTRPPYKAAALRVIRALSVHRLTTSDIYARLGATAEELRDDLCLLVSPMPERNAEFLKSVVETVLKEITKTVSGQFLTFNPENGQYYLDLKKDVDFDSLIDKKGESLSESQLDTYYFDALRRVVLEDPDATPYVGGYKIWEHDVEWREHRTERSGYLFFGAPNERSTAQPPRDFYLYFLQPFDPPDFKDEKKPDEAFFHFKARDAAFDRALRLFAGAREQAATASSGNKKIYEEKAGQHLQTLTLWLRERMASAFSVSYQGRQATLHEIVRGKLPSSPTVRDMVNVAAGSLLAPHFQDQSPDYPTFAVLVTRRNRQQATQEALRWISGGVKSKQGTAILDALELLDGSTLRPRASRYAKHVLDLLSQKGQGQVLNRAELVQPLAGVEYWSRFRLEPEFLAVVLAALVQTGDLVLSTVGKKIDAASLDIFSQVGIDEVRDFKHVERPRDLPLAPLQELFELLDLPKGLVVNPATREEAVLRLQQRVVELSGTVASAQARVPDLVLWGKPVLAEAEQSDWRNRLAGLKAFLESLQPYNTEGRLKNFSHDTAGIEAQRGPLALVADVGRLLELIQEAASLTSYLGKAEAVLQSGHPWLESVRELRSGLIAQLGDPQQRSDAGFRREFLDSLTALKSRYQEAYFAAHAQARLGVTDDKKKAALMTDARLRQLQKLEVVEMMPAQQLRDLQNRLFALKPCYSLTKQDLDTDAVCPHCSFRPIEESTGPSAAATLAECEQRLESLVQEWTRTLLTNLQDPTVAANRDLVSQPAGRRAIDGLLKSRELPEPVPPALVKALQEVLGGLQKVVVPSAEFTAALSAGGAPSTLDDLRQRLETYLANLARGKDAAKVRVVIE